MTTTDPGAAQKDTAAQVHSGVTGLHSVAAQGRNARQGHLGGNGPHFLSAHSSVDNQGARSVEGSNIDTGQTRGDFRSTTAGVEQSPTDPPMGSADAIALAAGSSASTPPGAPKGYPTAIPGAACPEVQTPPAASVNPAPPICAAAPLAAHNIDPGQIEADAQTHCAGVEHYIDSGHAGGGSQAVSAAVELSPPAPVRADPTPRMEAPVLADPLLALSADVLDDLERVRIANENRLRQLTRTATDADGEDRGFGLDESHPDVARLAALVEALGKAEHTAELNLSRQMRAHALGPWVKTTTGVGEKQAARLLACIGDPYMRPELERDGEVEPARPRLVSELWSYCGYGDARAQVRRRGVQANWDDTAKKRAWLISANGIKTLRAPCHVPDGQSWAEHTDDCRCGPYRLVYDEARRKYDGTVHPEACVRCGPSGKPAVAGSLRSAGHQHAMALRAMSKALLRDLWREARRLHGVTDEEDPA